MVLVCFNNWQKVLAGVFVTLFPFIDDFHFERKDLNSHMYQLWPEWSCFWIVDEPPERPYCTTWDVTPVFHGGYSPRIYVAYLHGCYTYNAWDAHPSSWWFIDVHRCSMWSTIEKKCDLGQHSNMWWLWSYDFATRKPLEISLRVVFHGGSLVVSQDPDDPQKAGVEKNGVPRNAEEYEWLILFDSHRIARSMAEKWGSNEVDFHDFCIRNHNKKLHHWQYKFAKLESWKHQALLFVSHELSRMGLHQSVWFQMCVQRWLQGCGLHDRPVALSWCNHRMDELQTTIRW